MGKTQIDITSCIDCPFRYDDYNDYAIGNDTIVICNLSRYLQMDISIIDSYNSMEYCDYCNELTEFDEYESEKCSCNHKKTKTPDWCPIKNKNDKIEIKCN